LTVGGIFSLAGCGPKIPSNLGPIVPVQGKVTLDGQPLKGGNVTFHPLDHDEKLGTPLGVIDLEGNYSMVSYDRKGAPVGKYRVTIDTGGEDKAQDRLVDPIYADRQNSPLTITVQENAPAGDYDLKLKIGSRH
jgi:hypothetical protein